MNPDDEQTIVECPKCGGRPAPGHTCDLCHGSGIVTAASRAFWRAANLSHGSGEHRLELGKK